MPPSRPPGAIPRGNQPQQIFPDDDEEVPELPRGRLLPTPNRLPPGQGAPPPGSFQSQPLAPPPLRWLRNRPALPDVPGEHGVQGVTRIDQRLGFIVALRHDLGRFIALLPPALRRCCAILMSGSVGEAIQKENLHRSSYYEALGRLRCRAREAGLHHYLGDPDKSKNGPVSNLGERPARA